MQLIDPTVIDATRQKESKKKNGKIKRLKTILGALKVKARYSGKQTEQEQTIRNIEICPPFVLSMRSDFLMGKRKLHFSKMQKFKQRIQN